MSLLISDLLNYSKVIAQTDYEFHPIKLGDVIQTGITKFGIQSYKVKRKNPIRSFAKNRNSSISNAASLHEFDWQFTEVSKNGNPPFIEITSESSHSSNGNLIYKMSVKDNGIGFNQKYIEKAFKPLEQLVGRSEYEDTGMGLSIYKRIIERHGGAITAKSSLGEGSTFTIALPSKQVQET